MSVCGSVRVGLQKWTHAGFSSRLDFRVINNMYVFWAMEESWRTQRKPTHIWGECAGKAPNKEFYQDCETTSTLPMHDT